MKVILREEVSSLGQIGDIVDVANRAENLAAKLNTITCEIAKQVGEEGKIFGSVTAMDIAKALEEKGIEIDKRKIVLETPIKHIGDYEVPIKLHPEVQAFLKVKVVGA